MTEQRRWSGSWARSRAGRVVVASSAGTADEGAPFTQSTRSQAGSISKQLVAVAVLQLVEQGELRLTDTAGDVLREPAATWRAVTVAQLLSHSGGIAHWRGLTGYDIENPSPDGELFGLIATTPLLHEPGSRFSYSGPGYLLAARIVEAVTGRTYFDQVTEHVLRAAQMTDSTSGEYPAARSAVARGHHDGRPVPLSPRLTEMPGTGDLWTTTGDLLRFAAALRDGVLLAQRTLALMRTPHIGIDDDSGELVAHGYGLGTYLGTLHDRPAFFHPGDNPGYTSLLAHLPETEEDIVLLANEDTLTPADMARLVDPV